jgi:hypothetical protein
VVLNQATPRTPRLQRKNGGSIPTIEEEDAKRPNREREKLVSDRTRIINRMKSNFPVARLENGLKRPGGRSRPTPRRLASLVVADAFVGELTRGSIGTIPATVETENTRSHQGGVRLPREDSNSRIQRRVANAGAVGGPRGR